MTEIQDNAFDVEVLKDQGNVMVDFYSPNCQPCKMLDKTLNDVEKQLGNSVKIVKVNVYKSPESATRFSVMSVPTVITFKKGRVTGCLTGSQKKDDYIRLINNI